MSDTKIFFTSDQLPTNKIMFIKKIPSGKEIATILKHDASDEEVITMFRSLVEIPEIPNKA